MFDHLQYLPIPWPLYALLFIALALLAGLIQVGVLRYAYLQLGITPGAAMLLLLASLLGAYINIPVASLPGETVVMGNEIDFFGRRYLVPEVVDWPGTVIAINVGGAVIPTALSLYLLAKRNIWVSGLVATAVVAAVCYKLAQPVRGVGISIPLLVPPLVACAVACVVSWRNAAALAYVSGSLGTLAGADLMNLPAIRGLGTPVASIGGAGTFDGIFVTGILAVLLASLIGKPRDDAVSG